MEEYKEVFSKFYSTHPLGCGVIGNNVYIKKQSCYSSRIEQIALFNLNGETWWSKSQLVEIFPEEEIDRLFDSIYLDLCSSGFIESTHIHSFLADKIFSNRSFPHFGQAEQTFICSESFFSLKLDQSPMGVNLWKIIRKLTEKGNNMVAHNIRYNFKEFYFLVKLNSTEEWINSAKLKSLDANLYFSVLQEMFERKEEKSKYMRRILFISFLSHYGFTKTIENEIVSPCNDVFGCYDLQRYIGSFL